MPPLEVLRLLREAGSRLGESTFYRIFRVEREKLPAEFMVRFEGVAGEFAQFDFAQVDVRLLSGKKRRIHFAAYRLKYSRWMWVVIVPDERVEALVRALLLCFEHSGGVPLSVVFDRPKTVVIGFEDKRPIWNATLAQVAIDYGFAIELCAARSPEQKGAVENLVGFVKRRFFRARRFADLEEYLTRQLLEWLTEVNEERPSRATKVVPSVRAGRGARPYEAAGGRTGRVRAALRRAGRSHRTRQFPGDPLRHAGGRLRDPGHAPSLPGPSPHCDLRRALRGLRFPKTGNTSYLAGQRAEQLAAVAGARKRLYFMRERILELGPIGESYLTELIHARPYTWKRDVERLFMLLEELGEDRFLRLLQRALFQRLYGAEYVVKLAAREVAS